MKKKTADKNNIYKHQKIKTYDKQKVFLRSG
jgi:hypothetical protein